MSREIKLGVVGFGRRGSSMADICNGFEHVKLTAVCDNSAEALSNAANKYPDAKQYGNFEQMLKSSGINAVLVETPGDNHARFCAMSLERDIHVFSDIPSVNSLEEADMLWKAAATSKAMFMTGANPNFWGFNAPSPVSLREGLRMTLPGIFANESASCEGKTVRISYPWEK